MDENDVEIIKGFLETIQEVCTGTFSAHRVKSASITWRPYYDGVSNDGTFWCPCLDLQFIDAPMAKEVKDGSASYQ